MEPEKERTSYNAVDLMSLGATALNYLLESLLLSEGTAVLAGKPDIGKSQLARQLCLHVALGMSEFLGHNLNVKHKSAIYVSTEDGAHATRNQLCKQLKGLGKDPAEGLRFIFAETMEPKEIVDQLEMHLKTAPADLVVIDSFGDIFNGGDSNNNMAMRNSIKPFARLASVHNCLILFTHHVNKGAYNQAPGQEHIQGGSGLVQKIRTALLLSDGEGNIRYLSVVKGNYTSKRLKKNSSILEFDEESLLFTSTGSLKPTADIGAKSEEKREDKYEVLEEIAQTIFGGRELSTGAFVKEYCDAYGKGPATAYRILKALKKFELIASSPSGYRLTPLKATGPVSAPV